MTHKGTRAGTLPRVACADCARCRVTGHGGRCAEAGGRDVGDVSRPRQCLYYVDRRDAAARRREPEG